MHNLSETSSGLVRFAYNPDGGDPWHRLGQPVHGARTIDEMLVLSGTDYTVQKFPAYTIDADGQPLPVDGQYITGFEEVTLGEAGFETVRHHFGPVSTTYRVEQNWQTTQFAVDLLHAAGGDGQIETIGALAEGRKFFVAVQLPSTVIDPGGIADVMKRYIAALNRHDGAGSLQALNTDVRVVCENTEQMALKEGLSLVSIRHTQSKEDRKAEAVRAMEVRVAHDQAFVEQAYKMLSIPVGPAQLERVVHGVFGPKPVDNDRVGKSWEDRFADIERRFLNERNAEAVGRNGWALYNAFTEYVDHGRKRIRPAQRSQQAIDPSSSGSKLKVKAAEQVLALA